MIDRHEQFCFFSYLERARPHPARKTTTRIITTTVIIIIIIIIINMFFTEFSGGEL